MKLAVIKTGGKQYLVKEGDQLKIEKIDKNVGDKINFKDVLLISDIDGDIVNIGNPFLEGAKIEAVVLEQGRAKKVIVIKYKPKVRYKRTLGHKQDYTKVKIIKIE